MSLNNRMPSEEIAVLSAINPASGTSFATAWVEIGMFNRVLGIIQTGAVGGDVDFKIEQADNASGDNPIDVTGKAITTIVDGPTADNKQAMIDLKPEETADDKPYIRLSGTAGAATLASGLLFGVGPRYAPAKQAASVVEIVR